MEYLIHLSIILLIYSGLAVSLSVLVGKAGIFSVAHATWFGVGAYATALSMFGGYSYGTSVVVAISVTLVVSAFVSIVLLPLAKEQYAIGSFGYSVLFSTILIQGASVTHGTVGMFGIPRPTVFGFLLESNISFLVFTAVVLGSAVTILWYITRSHFGRVLCAIRDDEPALKVFHYNINHFKVLIYAITSAVAALCGTLYATYVSFIDPSSFSLTESIFILTLVAVGGLGSLRGSALGAATLMLLPEMLRFVGVPSESAAEWRMVIYGILLVYVGLYRPQGFFARPHLTAA